MRLRRRLAPAFPVCVSLALSACAGFSLDETQSPPPRPAAAAAKPVVSSAPPPTRPAAKPATPDLNALRPNPRPDTAATAGAAPRLVGLSEDETVGLLGRPAEESAQPPGKVWIYRASGCQLSVHLFPDMERGGYYTLDYTADGARDQCLGKVAGEARRRGGALSEQASKAG